jgi:hypothetical protein
LFIVMDLFALRYWKPSTWSKPDLVLLLPGLVIGIGLGYLLFRFLDHRAIAIVIGDHADLCQPMVSWRRDGNDPSALVTKGDRCRSGIGELPPWWRIRVDASCDVSAAAWPQQRTLCWNDEPVLHGQQRRQGSAVAAAGETDGQRLDVDGDLPARHSIPAYGLAGGFTEGWTNVSFIGPATDCCS